MTSKLPTRCRIELLAYYERQSNIPVIMTSLHLSVVAGTRLALGLPIDQAIQRMLKCAADLNASVAKAPAGQGFGERVAQAVKNKVASATRPRTPVFAVSATVAPKTEDDSFGEQLRKEVEKRSGRKQHEEQAERERSRYPKPRQRGKSE